MKFRGVKRFLIRVGTMLLLVLMLMVYGLIKGWIPRSWILPTISPSPSPHSSPSPSPTPQNHVMKIGIDTRPCDIPFYAVNEFMDIKDKNVTVEIIAVPDAELRWQMLASGRLQLACGSLDSFVQALGRQNTGSMIFTIGTSEGMDTLLVASTLTDIRKLKGKKVAVAVGSPGAYLMAFFLDRVGMSPSEVQIVDAEDPRDAARLLEMGKVQGAWIWEPHARDLLGKGFHILASSPGQDIIQDICAANHETLADRGDLLAVMRGWFSMMSLLKNNPGLAREPIARKLKMTSSEVGQLLAGFRFADLAENQHLDAEAIGRQMSRIQEFWKLTRGQSVVPLDPTSVTLEPLSSVEITVPSNLFGKPAESPSPPPPPPADRLPRARFTPVESPTTDSSPSSDPSSDTNQ